MDYDKLPCAHLRLVFVFFGLFLFLNLNLLSGTIKTESVTVPVDEVVDSASKLLETSKTLAFKDLFERGENAPDGSFLKQIFKKKSLLVKNLMTLVLNGQTEIDQYVLVGEGSFLDFMTSFFADNAKETGRVAFMGSSNYYEDLVGFPMRRSLDAKIKRFINAR